MEVGVQSGAHLQLARRGDTASPVTSRNLMKPRLILFFTRDRTFDQLVRKAFFRTGATKKSRRSKGEIPTNRS
jgi:hypothetical protein